MARAVLRHRLYDLGRIVSRTIAYSLTTAGAVSVYLLTVMLLGSVVQRAAAGQQSTLVIAASTLTAAAAVQPMHHRVQKVIDRRFDRARYDTLSVLKAYQSVLRSSVDLDTINNELLRAAASATKPSSVRIWLLGDAPDRETERLRADAYDAFRETRACPDPPCELSPHGVSDSPRPTVTGRLSHASSVTIRSCHRS